MVLFCVCLVGTSRVVRLTIDLLYRSVCLGYCLSFVIYCCFSAKVFNSSGSLHFYWCGLLLHNVALSECCVMLGFVLGLIVCLWF